MSTKISAVLCTYDRPAYLRKALGSLIDQTLSKELYEIIVVDNGSRDNTMRVVSEFGGVSNVRYLREPVVGLSRARNTAWRNACGTYIAFLDDDAIAAPTWLSVLLEVFDSYTPRPGMVGGRIEAIWEVPQPEWLSDDLLGVLSIYHWSDAPRDLNAAEWVSACNMAVPRDLLEQAGGLREDLGRQGVTMRAGGETYLRKQLDSWGYRTVYHPAAIVYHHVTASRVMKKHFTNWAYWQGLSDAFMIDPDGRLPDLGRVRLALAKIGWALPRSLLAIAPTGATTRFRRECQVIEAAGYLSGLWQSRARRAR
jgi:glycosyltransferase involved in cell wall biosynthesis